LQDIAHQAMKKREDSMGSEMYHLLSQRVMLQSVNDQWMDHLQMIEYIREGIGLRGYGQVDPLVAYKRETFDLFQVTLDKIRSQSVRMLFHAQIQMDAPVEQEALEASEVLAGEPTGNPGEWPASADPKLVGRNDLCPCGSGKKFKACHYPIFRSQGLI
jgi:preprotein translocase subunit SecA